MYVTNQYALNFNPIIFMISRKRFSFSYMIILIIIGIKPNNTNGKNNPPTPSTIENVLKGFNLAAVVGCGHGNVVILIPWLPGKRLFNIALFIKDTMDGQFN